MKIYVLTVTDDSCGEFVHAHRTKAGAIREVQNDLTDRYGSPCSCIEQGELEAMRAEAEQELLLEEIWENDGVTYRIDAVELED